MEKSRMIIGAVAIVAIGMVFAGVGYAVIEYTGTATNTDNTSSSEFITTELTSYSGFLSGIYTVDTENNGTNVTLSNLSKDGGAVSLYTGKSFAYSAGAFSVIDYSAEAAYAAYEVGSVTVTMRQPTDATATHVSLAVSGAEAAVINQYGLSLVYVSDDTVVNPNGSRTITMNAGVGTFTLKAYVVYSKSVPLANIASIGAFNLDSADLEFEATATDQAP